MANPFDQFDAQEANPFDQFDQPAAKGPSVEIVSVDGKEPDVPEWGRNNPNLYGVYGAGRELIQTGAEALGAAGGAAAGLATPVPGGSLAGSGMGYAAGKRVGEGIVSAMDTAVGDPQARPEESAGRVAGDVAFGAVAQGAGNLVAKGISKLIPKSIIDKMYASSLKLPTTMENKARQAVIRKGLSEKAVPSSDVGTIGRWLGMKGHAQIVQKIDMLDDQVSKIIKNSSEAGDVVDSQVIVKYLDDFLEKGKRVSRVDPNFAEAIQKVQAEFMRGPREIPVAEAQEMKRHIYKVYQDYYGMPDAVGAYIQGKKTIARGIKEQLETKYPDIKALNMEEGELLTFLDPFNRAIGRIQNRDIVGLGMQTAPMAGAALGGTGAGQVAAALKVIDTPSVKARVSILLNQAKRKTPGPLRQIVGKTIPTASIATREDNQ
jgi:hypothetical protein